MQLCLLLTAYILIGYIFTEIFMRFFLNKHIKITETMKIIKYTNGNQIPKEKEDIINTEPFKRLMYSIYISKKQTIFKDYLVSKFGMNIYKLSYFLMKSFILLTWIISIPLMFISLEIKKLYFVYIKDYDDDRCSRYILRIIYRYHDIITNRDNTEKEKYKI